MRSRLQCSVASRFHYLSTFLYLSRAGDFARDSKKQAHSREFPRLKRPRRPPADVHGKHDVKHDYCG